MERAWCVALPDCAASAGACLCFFFGLRTNRRIDPVHLRISCGNGYLAGSARLMRLGIRPCFRQTTAKNVSRDGAAECDSLEAASADVADLRHFEFQSGLCRRSIRVLSFFLGIDTTHAERLAGGFSGAESGGSGEKPVDGDDQRVCRFPERIPSEWAADESGGIGSKVEGRVEPANGLDGVLRGRLRLLVQGCNKRDRSDSRAGSQGDLDHTQDARRMEAEERTLTSDLAV